MEYILIFILFVILGSVAVYGYNLYKQLDEEIEELYDLFYDQIELKGNNVKKKGKVIEL